MVLLLLLLQTAAELLLMLLMLLLQAARLLLLLHEPWPLPKALQEALSSAALARTCLCSCSSSLAQAPAWPPAAAMPTHEEGEADSTLEAIAASASS